MCVGEIDAVCEFCAFGYGVCDNMLSSCVYGKLPCRYVEHLVRVMPMHVIDRVCTLLGLCAFRGARSKSRKDAYPNLLLMEEASEVAIKSRASVKLEGSHMRTRLVPGQGVAAW